MTVQTSDIQLAVKGKSANAHLADGKGSGVLLFHAWWGLKPFFKQTCNRIAEQGFTVLAPDLMDGKIAKTIDEAKELINNMDEEFTGDIVNAAKDHLRGITKGKIGTIGFSMGGGWALDVASHFSNQVGAVVLYYGNGEADYGKIASKVMGHFSDADEWEPMEYVNNTFDELKKASVDCTMHIYPDAAHWFMEDDRPEYDPQAAKLAWERTYKFLKENL